MCQNHAPKFSFSIGAPRLRYGICGLRGSDKVRALVFNHSSEAVGHTATCWRAVPHKPVCFRVESLRRLEREAPVEIYSRLILPLVRDLFVGNSGWGEGHIFVRYEL